MFDITIEGIDRANSEHSRYEVTTRLLEHTGLTGGAKA